MVTYRKAGALGATGGVSGLVAGLNGRIGAVAGAVDPKRLAAGMTKVAKALADAARLARLRQLCFPLDVKKKSFNRNFEDPRPPGRLHAGCDLLAPADTPVLAMSSGKVIACNKDFFVVTPGGHQLVRKNGVWGRAVLKGEPLEQEQDEKGKTWYVIKDDKGIHKYTEDQFFRTDAVAVQHDYFCDLEKPSAFKPPLPGFVVRYGEIVARKGISEGSEVKRGQPIGVVARQRGPAMLHLEMFKGTESGRLTDENSADAKKRRADVTDPTPYLEVAKLLSQLV